MDLKGKKFIAAAGVLAVLAAGCGTPKTEWDRFISANIEKDCYLKEFFGDRDPSTVTETEVADLEKRYMDVLAKNGFEVSTPEEVPVLAQRLYDQAVSENTLAEYEEKYLTKMLAKGCMTQEEVDQAKKMQAEANAVIETPIVTEEITTPVIETPEEVETVPTTM